jgi:predicted enzyme related to lactoylglutathione lyase
MAKVLGVGGVFFKSKDPKMIAQWYQTWLGFTIDTSFNGTSFQAAAMPETGCTVWSPFAADTEYFQPSGQAYMINLIVDDLEGALAQVEKGGATLVGQPEEFDYGKFGWFLDPEGNKVELWQPA